MVVGRDEATHSIPDSRRDVHRVANLASRPPCRRVVAIGVREEDAIHLVDPIIVIIARPYRVVPSRVTPHRRAERFDVRGGLGKELRTAGVVLRVAQLSIDSVALHESYPPAPVVLAQPLGAAGTVGYKVRVEVEAQAEAFKVLGRHSLRIAHLLHRRAVRQRPATRWLARGPFFDWR